MSVNPISGRDQILRKLARRNWSSYELKHKFGREIAEIDEVVNEFVQKGYINDDEWLKNFVQAEESKGKGPMAIGAKLRAKGFPRPIIEGYLAGLSSENALETALRKKTRGKPELLSNPAGRQKLIGFLMRRGFAGDDISRALKL